MENTTKRYEVTVLARVGSDCDKIKRTIEAATNGGVVKEGTNRETRQMSYPISGQEFATYLYYEIEGTSATVRELSSKLNSDDSVLRYLIVQQDSIVSKAVERLNDAVSEQQLSARMYFRVLKLAYCYKTGEERAGTSAEITQKMKELEEQNPYKAVGIYGCATRIVNALL